MDFIPPDFTFRTRFQHHIVQYGELAQLGERLVCNQEVTGSSPVFSTNLRSPTHGLTPRRDASFGWQASRSGEGCAPERPQVAKAGDGQGGFFDN